MMLLLDTHVVLWLLTDGGRLGNRARELIAGGGTAYVSAASLWEIAIKADLGKIRVPDALPSLITAAGLAWLPVSPQHAWQSRQIAGLPQNRDPFDRLLISQAVCESLTFLTADRVLLGCGIEPEVEIVDARL